MSVTRLARLLETGQYKLCLEEANLLLAGGGHDPERKARILSAVCRSCLELADCHGAVAAGRQAAEAAEAAAAPDVLGAVLVDLGTAMVRTRRHQEALPIFRRYLAGLDACTAARCLEGTALRQMAAACRGAGRLQEALDCYERAQRWFQRFGDETAVGECLRARIQIHLDRNEPDRAFPLLKESDRRLVESADTGARFERLLDWAAYYQATGRFDAAARTGFAALEAADGDLSRQCRAQLLLSRTALGQAKPAEALALAFAARVSAIDGRLYAMEFEATDILFRLLEQGGAPLLQEVEADFAQQGVTIAEYLSDRVLRERLR